MIVELLVSAVLDLLTLILSTIPDATLPTAATDALDSFATIVGGSLGGLDRVFPVTEVSTFVGWVLVTVVPILGVWCVSFWAWKNAPIIGGNG